MTDLLFHKVSEKEKEEIKREARKILENFSKKLSRIEKKIPEPLIELGEGDRKECDLDSGKEKKLGLSREIFLRMFQIKILIL